MIFIHNSCRMNKVHRVLFRLPPTCHGGKSPYGDAMPTKINPKSLNSLQLRTLAIFQRLATLEQHVHRAHDDGAVTIWNLPHPHGDHFHLGSEVVPSRDASGLANPAVWSALERKGLIKGEFPHAVTLSREARDYPVGPLGIFAENADH